MVVIGLKKRDTFEEVVEYLKHPKDVIRFPNRYAKQIRNSFELSQLDGVGMMEHEQHELQTMKETEKADALRKVAMNNNDVSHHGLRAHAEQSRPPVNTTSTIQQTEPMNIKIHTDSDDNIVFGSADESSKEQYKNEARQLRETAELEYRAKSVANERKLKQVTDKHKKDLDDIHIVYNTQHHQAQEVMRQQMSQQHESAEQMANYHRRIQDQRHQAELQQLANQYRGLHQELEQYHNREAELEDREVEITRLEEQAPRKVRIVTRSIADEPFNTPSHHSWEVPMAAPPPKALPPPAPPPPAPPPKALPPPAKAPPAKNIGPIGTVQPLALPPPAKDRGPMIVPPAAKANPKGRPRAPAGEPIPRRRDLIIDYIRARGGVITEQQENGPNKLKVEDLKARARLLL